MCEFISWVEKQGKVYFLTGEQLFSEKGKRWLKENGVSPDDYCGHGTIRRFYQIEPHEGKNKECADFSSPSNFPPEIITALKRGLFKGFSFPSKGLLRKPLYDDYKAKCKPLDDDYRANCTAIYDDYEAKRTSLTDDCWKLFADSANRSKAWSD